MPVGVTVRLYWPGVEKNLQGLIRPGGLAIRSCDPHICIHTDQPSRLVGMRGDFQRKGKGRTISVSRYRPPRAQILRAEFDTISICDSITGKRASRLFGAAVQPSLEQQEQSDEH